MDILPIWGTKKFVYQGANVIEYRVLAGENEIFHGRAVKSPATGVIEIELNRICSSYLNSLLLPEYLNNALDEDTVAWGSAYKEFSVQVYDIDTGTWSTEDQWAFVNDYSYEDHSIQFGIFSEPINGHSAPGMLLPYSFLTTGDSSTVCYDEMNYMPYITIDPEYISFSRLGGSATITVTSNSNWRIADEYANYFSQSAGGTGITQITLTLPENTWGYNLNMPIRFKATNDKGSKTVTLTVAQSSANVFLNVTKGDGSMFDTVGGAWDLEYEANIVVAYYEFSGGQTGYTTGGRLSVDVPSGDTDQMYSVNFYDAPGGVLLDSAYANRLKGLHNYLHFEFLEDGEILFCHPYGASPLSIEYTRNTGATWETATSSREGYSITGNTGDIIYLKGTNPTYAPESAEYHAFAGSTKCTVGGNIMSLTYGDDFADKNTIENDWQFSNLFGGGAGKSFSGLVSAEELLLPATILKPYCYADMFYFCTSLTKAPEIRGTSLAEGCYTSMFQHCRSLVAAPVLPATELAGWCYSEMFVGCTSLVNAPVLPATTLARYCYSHMFENCTSLATAPALPATALAEYCYTGMFSGCNNLVNAPVLPATELAGWCYDGMFNNCTSLTTAPAISATTLAVDCCYRMFNECSSLVNPPALLATTLAQGCYLEMFSKCTSLVTAPALPATTLANGCYHGMFYKCTSLVNAPVLPATTLAEDCYIYMFRGCTSLTTAPALPATTLAKSCYYYMFNECSSLVNAPVLPATTLAEDCYGGMFNRCTSLTTAPVLPATTLESGCYSTMFSYCTLLTTAPDLPAATLPSVCYSFMFEGCHSLNYIKCLATNIDTSSTTGWVYFVPSTGTFVKNASTTWSTGTSGIPSGWTVQNA